MASENGGRRRLVGVGANATMALAGVWRLTCWLGGSAGLGRGSTRGVSGFAHSAGCCYHLERKIGWMLF